MPGPAGGASGNEIGRVTVRVTPDLTGFAKKVRTKLKAALAGLDKSVPITATVSGLAKAESAISTVARDRSATIDVDAQAVDVDRFQRRLLADLKKAMASAEVKIPLTAEGEELRREIQLAETELADKIALKIPFDLQEAAAARANIDSLIRKVKEYEAAIPDRLEFKTVDEKTLLRFGKQVDKFLDEQAAKELTLDTTALSDKQLFRAGKQIDKFLEEQREKELTFDNTALTDRLTLRLNRQFDKFLEEQRAKELTFDNTALSERQSLKLNKQIDGFLDEQRAKELTIDNTSISEKGQLRFLRSWDKLKAQVESEQLTFENTELSEKAKFKFLQNFDNLKVKIDLETEKARAELAALQKEAAERMTLRPDFSAVSGDGWWTEVDSLKVKAELDSSLAEIAWDRTRQRLEQEKWNAKITPSVDLAPVDSAIERIRARFRNAKFQAEVGSLKADDILPDLNGVAARGAKGIAGLGVSFALSVPSLLSFKGALLAVIAAIAVLLPPVLALGVGVISLAPAFLAILAPISAVMLGLDGIKKAAEKAGLFKDEKPGKKGGGSVGASLDAIREKVSATFEKGLEPAFANIKQLFADTGFQNVFSGVADGLSKMATGFTNAVSKGQGLSDIKSIIANVGSGLAAAAPGVEAFTNGILRLVAAISEKFPGLGRWFTEIGEKFSQSMKRFTTDLDGNGQTGLDRLVENTRKGIESLTGLFQTFWNQGLSDITNNGFGDSIKSFVDSIDSLVRETLPALSGAFQTIATALKPVAAVVDSISSVLDKLPSSEGGFIPDWVPLLGSWDNILGGSGGDISKQAEQAGVELAASLNNGLQQGLEAGAQIGTDFFDMSQVGEAVKQQINQAINVSKEDQAQALRSAFTPGGVDTAVSQQLTQQVTAAVQGAKNAMANLGPELQGLIDTALMPLATIGDRVGQAFSTMGPAINNAFIAAMAGVRNTITGLFAFMVLAIGTQTSKISNSIGQAFQGAPQQVGAALAGVPGAVAGALAPAIAAAANAAVGMLQAMNAGLAALPAVVQAWFGAVPATVQGAMSPAIGTVASVCQQIVSTMLSFAGAAEQAGTAIGASFAKGIASATNLVISSASALMNAARAFFPASPAEKGPFSGKGWVTYSGQSIGDGFAQGLRDSTSGVVSTAKELMQALKDVFGTAEGVNFNFIFGGAGGVAGATGSSIAGIGNQMSSIASSAQTFQTSMEGAATSLTPLSSGDIKEQIDALSQQLLDLEIQRKTLMQQKYAGADKNALKAQLDQIAAQKNALGLQKDQLNYQLKYGGAVNQTTQGYQDQIKSLQQMPVNFATANANQFMTDLGWSGQGAIPSLLQQGMDFGTNFIFNVANMDDALSGQRVLQNRTAQATLGR